MFARLRSTIRRRRLDAELEQELEFHLQSLEAQYRARGVSPDEAKRLARLDIGSRSGVIEAYRDQNSIPILDTLLRNLRFAGRSLRRTPAVSVVIIATLAIGIGGTAAIFAVVNGILLKPLPFPDADALIAVNHGLTGTGDELPSAPYLYFTYREENRTLAGVGLWSTRAVNVTGFDRPEEVRALFVTADVLPILGIQPLLGRQFSGQDDSPLAPPTLLLTYGYWQRRFGGDASAVGRPLVVDGQSGDVIGVMPKRFRFLDQQVDVIIPFQLDPSQVTLGRYVFPSIARLKPGSSLADASADIVRMVPLARERFPPPPGYTRDQFARHPVTPRLTPLKQVLVGDVSRTLWVLMGALGLLLLIACANVANLLLARAEGRQRELAIRAALGASRSRISGELLVESTLLGLLGGIAGLLLAWQGLHLLVAAGPANLPRLDEIGIDSTVLLFTFALSVLAGVLFGLLPVVKYANPSVATSLSSGGRTMGDSRERHRARGMLVIIQVATALVLLVCSGLMIRTYQVLRKVDPGFGQPHDVQMLHINVPIGAVPDAERVARVQHEIVDRLAAIAGVESVAFGDLQPLDAANTGSDTVLMIDGRTNAPGQVRPLRRFEFISPALFQTLRAPLITGREFNWVDLHDTRLVAVVSEGLARGEWQSPTAALGKRVRASPDDPWREIVGVVGDIHDNGMHLQAPPTVYFPALLERFWSMPIASFRSTTFIIRTTRAGTAGLIREIEKAVSDVNPSLALADLRTLADVYEKSMARTSFALILLSIAGITGLFLGAIGVYAVLAYVVSQRTGEIGIRLALGASAGEVRRRFVYEGLALTSVGVATGLAAAAAVTQLMSSLLFGVSRLDPPTYAAMTFVLVVVAVFAAYIPAVRATRVSLVNALRQG
jgi:putative ABC transport system permease protein